MAIGIIDMNGAVSWDVISEVRSRASGEHVPTLAFGPHVDVENRRAAKAAGVDAASSPMVSSTATRRA